MTVNYLKKNVVLLGLGNIGYLHGIKKKNILSHVSAINQDKRLKFIAAHDLNEELIKKFVKEYCVFTSSNFERIKLKLKQTSVYLVIIAVNTKSHYKVLKKAITLKPKILLVEKPFCKTLHQALKIEKKCKKEKIKIYINYTRSFDHSWLKIKQNFLRNQFVRGTIIFNLGLQNNGSHFIHLCLYLFGKLKKITILNKKKFIIYFNNATIYFCERNQSIIKSNLILFYNDNFNFQDNGSNNFKLVIKKKKFFIKNNLATYMYNPLKVILNNDKHLLKDNLKNSIVVHEIIKKIHNQRINIK